MQRGYTTIDEVVNDFQLMIDDTSYDKDAQIHQLRLLALQGLRELTFDAEQVIKSIDITVSSSLANAVPSNFINIKRIGFIDENSNFQPLSNNPNLNINSNTRSSISVNSNEENNPYYHTDLGKKFGTGGGQNTLGYYRLDRDDNVIHFSSNLKGKRIVLDYISDGIGEVTPKDHIITIKFNGGSQSTQGGVKNNTKLVIPSPLNPNSVDTYVFKQKEKGNTILKREVFLKAGAGENIDATKEEIAKVFCDVVNNGNPEAREIPDAGFYRLKAVYTGVGVVNLVYTNTDYYNFVPIHLEFPRVFASSPLNRTVNLRTFNTSANDAGQIPGVTILKSQSLTQLGVAGHKPRVHNFCEEALRSYIYYKYIQRKRGIPANEKQMAKRAYYNEKRLARARMMNFGKEEAIQTSRKAFKQSPKF